MAASRFGLAYEGLYTRTNIPIEQIGRIQGRWGILRDRHEVWEVDYGYLPEYFSADGRRSEDPRLPDDDHDYWRTTPVGTISYIDRCDLPIETHYARARAIVAAGSEFAIVGDIERGELNVFRLSGVERHTEDFRLPEMPWFDVPIGRTREKT